MRNLIQKNRSYPKFKSFWSHNFGRTFSNVHISDEEKKIVHTQAKL